MSGALAILLGNAVGGTPLTLVASPAAVSGTGTGGVEGYATSDASTATPTGGSGTIVYGWTQISGDAINIDSPSSATTTFTGFPNLFTPKSGWFVCEGRDEGGTGDPAYSNEVYAEFTWT